MKYFNILQDVYLSLLRLPEEYRESRQSELYALCNILSKMANKTLEYTQSFYKARIKKEKDEKLALEILTLQ